MKYAVIGNPIDHSLSPVMHNANFEAINDNSTYEAINISEKQFHLIKEIINEKSLSGFNVTIPHKERIIPYLDDIDDQAKTVGAVNTVKIENGKWIGYNTDGIGYVTGLKQVYPDLKSAHILIIGAGGASKGIASELAKYVQPTLTVANRSLDRFEHWNLEVNKISLKEAEAALSEFDIVINTTPAGMKDNKDVVISLDQLSAHTLVSDIVYIPFKTPILEVAEAKGNPVHNGLDMFVYQGAESFKIWTGKTPQIQVMKDAVLKRL
ncbi:shikimate dehydrogenase [Staphylococcus succinus]|uniref:Shikimate dehydrogenase (NADP(+)) n=1 Tax=Staphylococcus succinus TaxID=61015 RepID=A0ABX5IQZ0_9STAP|nr:shikimate dehydrogenase [Staphylococcus succinus]MEB7461326.1 shikimate dehydrogenase [Staphylococcus succinus]PKI23340.1 shikimate dehydrogenase [Staphylococcus succinus]PTI70604.1 shikimate dehydrogenase [Staphylococcus succinus]PTJ84947.1 shikimate dehydrogenase [Staphylococcus succinus]RIN36234.1 shikimate dehydrogenase [Staphylococcus succinus]